MSSPFLTRHKGNTSERFHTPRRKRISLSSENIDPKEIQFSPVSKKPKDKFSTPRFSRIANDFEDDEIAMTKYQNRINELKQEILELNLDDLKRQQDKEINELVDKINAKKESLYQAASQLDNKKISNKLKENFITLNTLKDEVSMAQETTKIAHDAYDSFSKELEKTKYILKILPNETNDVFELAQKMIITNISFPLEKGERLARQLSDEHQNVKNEKELLSSFVTKLNNENEQLENDINSLRTAVQALSIERASLLQGNAFQQSQYSQPKRELDKQLYLMNKEFKHLVKEEKERIKKDLGALKVEKHILDLKYDWSKKQANELQENLERLNSEIDELSSSYSSSSSSYSTPQSSFEKQKKQRAHRSRTPKTPK